jgi:hypothetical protein
VDDAIGEDDDHPAVAVLGAEAGAEDAAGGEGGVQKAAFGVAGGGDFEATAAGGDAAGYDLAVVEDGDADGSVGGGAEVGAVPGAAPAEGGVGGFVGVEAADDPVVVADAGDDSLAIVERFVGVDCAAAGEGDSGGDGFGEDGLAGGGERGDVGAGGDGGDGGEELAAFHWLE